MKFIIFLSFFVTVSPTLIPKVGECSSTGTIYKLDAGDMLFVESPEFPTSLTTGNGEDIQCGVKFTRNDGKSSGIKFIFTNGFTNNFTFSTDDGEASQVSSSYDSTTDVVFFDAINQSSFSYSYNKGSGTDNWSAFQGFVYIPPVDEEPSNCWMNNMNITLLDNQRSLPLFSFDKSNPKPCTWTINVPDGMYMKLSIPMMDGYQLQVYPDGQDYISLGGNNVQYMRGKSFRIVYLPDETNTKDHIGVLILASATNQNTPVKNEVSGKEIKLDSNHAVISFFDGKNGYENNHRYSFPIAQKPGYLIVLQANKQFLEYIVDRVEVYDYLGMNYPMLDKSYYSVESLKDVNLVFSTDQTITGAGFFVNEITIECSCASTTFMLPCEGPQTLPLMNNENEIYTYCSNMTCDYSIMENPNCPNTGFTLKVDTNLRQISGDNLVVSTNDMILVNATDMNYEVSYSFQINSNQKTVINLKSGSVRASLGNTPTAYITFEKNDILEDAIVNDTVINDTIFSFIVNEFNNDDAVFISIAKEFNNDDTVFISIAKEFNHNDPVFISIANEFNHNDTVFISIAKEFNHNDAFDATFYIDEPSSLSGYSNADRKERYLHDYAQFERKNATSYNIPLGNSNYLPRFYQSTSGSLSIQGNSGLEATLFFRIREFHSKNCFDHFNVFQPTMSNSVSMKLVGKDPGTCIKTILAYGSDIPFVSLSDFVSMTSDDATVIAGVSMSNVYMKFNQDSASGWNDVVVAGPVNSVVVPGKSNLGWNFKFTNSKPQTIDESKTTHGVIYPLNYAIPGFSYGDKPVNVSTLETQSSETVITCKFLDLGVNDSLEVKMGSNVNKREGRECQKESKVITELALHLCIIERLNGPPLIAGSRFTAEHLAKQKRAVNKASGNVFTENKGVETNRESALATAVVLDRREERSIVRDFSPGRGQYEERTEVIVNRSADSFEDFPEEGGARGRSYAPPTFGQRTHKASAPIARENPSFYRREEFQREPVRRETTLSSYQNPPEESSMASGRFLGGVSLGIRLFILLLVIISMILVMTAPGVCFWREINGQQTSREICPPSNTLFPMNIDRWNSALHFQLRGQNIWGQLAIIILSVVFAIPPLVFSCVYFGTGRTLTMSQVITSGLAIVAFLVFGGFETWYATGFDHMPLFIRQIGGGTFSGCAGIPGCETGFVVKGWAAAAAFYFLAAILFIIDAIVTYMRKDNNSTVEPLPVVTTN
ncbi:hypothetical protein FO519_000072 [Halicephalobus sp. NKZ332]|nr:hypothetical protein FO519_000072 [Halicephalobus sp. NKZ332]